MHLTEHLSLTSRIAGIWRTSKQIESRGERITGEAVTLAGEGISPVACRPAGTT
jgi:hypothetical protein